MTAPFGGWERAIAVRYLLTKRSHGGVALISVISFTAIALAVAALIITMSIMNGFRSELSSKILGFNGHAYVVGGYMSAQDRAAMTARIRAVPGVVQAMGLVESQALVQGPLDAVGFAQQFRGHQRRQERVLRRADDEKPVRGASADSPRRLRRDCSGARAVAHPGRRAW